MATTTRRIRTFQDARARLGTLDTLAREHGEPLTAAVWSGLTSANPTGLVAEIVAESTPMNYAALLAGDAGAPAAAGAAMCLLEALSQTTGRAAPVLTDEYEVGKRVAAGWRKFDKLVEYSKKLVPGTGSDLSAVIGGVATMPNVASLRDKLAEIAALAGRMSAVLRGSMARNVPDRPELIVGVEMGGDPSALLPAEWAALATDATKYELFRAISEESALQVQRVGREKVGRGPLVLLLDESGSMDDGRRNTWAKAAAMALTQLAWKDARPVVWVHFSTNTVSAVLAPGDVSGLMLNAVKFLHGGTNISLALNVGHAEVEQLAREGKHGGDCILISDGAGGNVPAEVAAVERLRQLQVRTWGVAIDEPFPEPLKKACDGYLHLSDEMMNDPTKIISLGVALRA
jgi:hypothetical protein